MANITKVSLDGIIYDFGFTYGVKTTILWENTNSNESFIGQNIDITNISNYKFLIALFKATKDFNTMVSVVLMPNIYTQANLVWDGFSITRICRIISSGIEFQKAQICKTYGMSPETNNEYLIPRYIYGISI